MSLWLPKRVLLEDIFFVMVAAKIWQWYHDKIEVSMPTDDDFTTQLIERNRHLNALLQNTVETLEKERHLNAATKNRGAWWLLHDESGGRKKICGPYNEKNPGAALVFSVLREHMQIGTNAVTISNPALAKILGKSPRTIARATKHLVDHAFVQVIKTGNTNCYVVNEQVAFAGVTRATKSGVLYNRCGS
ncbi:helix-turn-helix domain-containing protein [Klebsiella michiganensis]|uniref:helix-turn-helix domain-containing protein n=1 Tax=Klebsiella michiganensis TaxID=1134687 RepID=UPI00115C96C2|nr:helix-turn-helix domain-containing protein [Klebsiella michiganensis]